METKTSLNNEETREHIALSGIEFQLFSIPVRSMVNILSELAWHTAFT
jgi:hypothetical protein